MSIAKANSRRRAAIRALAAVAALALVAAQPGRQPLRTRRVAGKTFRLTLRELGVIEAAKTMTVYNQVDGEIVWIAPEGARVKKGDPVVRLSNTLVEEEAEDYARRLEDSKMSLRRSKLDFDLQNREAALNLKRKEVEVRLAEWELRDIKQRSTEIEMKMLELDAQVAKFRSEHARLELEAARALRGSSIEAKEELREKETAYQKAVVARERAVGLLESAQKGPKRRLIEVAEKRLERARHGLHLQELSNRQQKNVGEAGIEIQSASLARTQQLADRYARRAQHLVVRAPMDGTVALMDVYKGQGEERSPIRVGETRTANMDMLKIADLSTLLVRLHVSEADIAKVKVGQPAEIRLVAFPDKVYRGQVTAIMPFAEDKNITLGRLAMSREGLAGVSVIDVLVKVIDLDPRLRLGLTARVDIQALELPDALTLPLTAVAFEGDQAYCYVSTRGKPVARRITLGPANEHEVVVTAGLEQDDRVALDVRQAAPRGARP